VLGPDHPDILDSRNNLAYAYKSAGDVGRAIPIYQQTVADAERVLGPDHPQHPHLSKQSGRRYRGNEILKDHPRRSSFHHDFKVDVPRGHRLAEGVPAETCVTTERSTNLTCGEDLELAS
jgi:hypothetical protein